MFVDNCAMQICKNPSQFDVIVTENMFGDTLSDEASEITGSIGMVPSSSLGATTCGLYEPIHGSAPDIAGQEDLRAPALVCTGRDGPFVLQLQQAGCQLKVLFSRSGEGTG